MVDDQYELAAGLEAPCYLVTGAGDSFAAALLAPHLNPRAAVYDPMDLAYSVDLKPLAERGCALIAISVGGRTRMVVEAAKRFKRVGGTVAAVTGDPTSPLASTSDHTVTIVHAGLAEGVGAGRHILTLTALAGLLDHPKPRVPSIEDVECPPRFYGYLFAGCCETVSTALFAALKVFEIYGLPAYWWPLEQLVHAPIYGMPGDRLLVYRPLAAAERVEEVVSTIGSLGVDVYTVEPWGSSKLENALWTVAWTLACLSKSSDLPDQPRYVSHPGLEALTRLIYA